MTPTVSTLQEELGVSYTRWYRLQNWIKVNTKELNQRDIYELNNCVTRYFISLPLAKGKENTVYDKFVQELKDKNIRIKTDIRNFEECSSIIAIPSVFLLVQDKINCRLTYGDFYASIPIKRYTLLKSMGSDEEILLMLLNYAMFPSSSLGWQVPAGVYKRMIFYHGLTLEGCASPTNSYILNHGGEYCSPFPSDKIFGSVGNFFDVDLHGEITLINPPFVEDFMLLAAKKVVDTLDNAVKNTSVMFVAPTWTDAESYILLSESKHLLRAYNLLKGQHSYEDATGKKIVAKFNSTIFVLSNVDVDFSDAIELFNTK